MFRQYLFKVKGGYTMNDIKKVSDITYKDVADYLRLTEVDDNEQNTLNNMLNIAKNYISTYTGQKDLDKFPDLIAVVFVLCQDMYDNRSMYVDKSSLNQFVETALGLHQVNLL